MRVWSLATGGTRLAAVMLAIAFVIASSLARAEDLAERASQLADAAFVMLNSLNSASADTSTGGPLLAPTAELASSAQSLANALKRGDRVGAGRAMATIVSDQAKVDAAAKGASPVITAEWGSVKTQIALLEKDVPQVKAPTGVASWPSASGEPRIATGREAPAPPKVVIESSTPDGDFVLVKGFLEGTDLKDAGVYDGGSKRKDINVAGVPGRQRVNFQFKIESPPPDETIQVTDVEGREASALVRSGAASAAAESASSLPGAAPDSSTELPSPPSDADDSASNTAEIPPAGYSTMGPSEPTRRLSGLGNTQITIVSLSPVPGRPGSFEVLGDISGRVRRAGVYLDGRLAAPISLKPGPYSSFDVVFTRLSTQNASIRAYGLGNDFVETSLAPGGSGITTFNNYRSSYRYGATPSAPPGGYP